MEARKAENFADLLKQYRLTAGLTQEALANRASLSVRAISDLERAAHTRPYRETIHRLATALGLDAVNQETLLSAARRLRDSFPANPPSENVRPPITLLRSPLVIPGHRLPARLSSFLGREREIAEVGRLLETIRLLTLTGTGGVGKSSLAVEIARFLMDAYPDGVVLVELAPVTDPVLVTSTVAAACGLRESPDQPILTTLLSFLTSRRVLLVLDNCEHLIEMCAVVVECILRAAPAVRVLATSREPLRAEGEATYHVPSLATPPLNHPPTADDVAHYAAPRLFVERAHRTRREFVLSALNVDGVVQICARLDGIPLAIELAAAQVRVLGVQQIAARLDDRFRLLTSGRRTALPRHQTLQSTMDWSHDLLSPKEQILFRRLAVFVDGWTIDAAEAVCADPEGVPVAESGERPPGRRPSARDRHSVVATDDVLNLLTGLIDKSLVLVEERGGERRYRYLETIRAYAWECLAEAGEIEISRGQHLAWCLSVAERAESEIFGTRQVEWLATLEAERPNLRVALDWGLTHNHEAGPRLAGALWQCWGIGSARVEGISWLEVALARAPERSRARAKICLGLAFCTREGGDLDRVKALTEESLTLFRELGDHRGSAWSLHNLGILSAFDGDLRSAVRLLEESTALFQAAGDPAGVGMNLRELGFHVALAESGGDRARGRELLERSRDLLRELGDCWNLGWTLRHLGDLARLEGDVNRASALLEESLGLFRKIEHHGGVIEVLRDLAKLAAHDHDDQRARRTLTSSIALAREIGHVSELSY